jgi:hypothetical protein
MVPLRIAKPVGSLEATAYFSSLCVYLGSTNTFKSGLHKIYQDKLGKAAFEEP